MRGSQISIDHESRVKDRMGDMGEIPKKGEIIEQSRVGIVFPELGACILSWERASRVGIVNPELGS